MKQTAINMPIISRRMLSRENRRNCSYSRVHISADINSCLGRYKFLAKSQQGDTVDGGEKVGLLKILSGDKHKSETMIFFGSTADAKISRCEYTLALADGEGKFTREKPLTDNGGNVWLIGFYGLSNYDSRTAKDITSARFFDENGNLVATYSK